MRIFGDGREREASPFGIRGVFEGDAAFILAEHSRRKHEDLQARIIIPKKKKMAKVDLLVTTKPGQTKAERIKEILDLISAHDRSKKAEKPKKSKATK